MTISNSDVDALIQLAHKASKAIMEIYNTNTTVVEYKDDNSPLTQADRLSHEIITSGLAELFPNIPIVSEEGDMKNNRETIQQSTYWLVDPIDGTRDFVDRTGEFCIAIGLIDGDKPSFGFIAAPTLDTIYYGGPAMGSYKKTGGNASVAIHTHTLDPHVVAISRSHVTPATDKYIRTHLPNSPRRQLGSMLKQAALAEGVLDVYPCIGQPLKFWDLAAGYAIMEGAGAHIIRPSGEPFNWHQTDNFKVGDFIAQA